VNVRGRLQRRDTSAARDGNVNAMTSAVVKRKYPI
jgi:hypothetical protein